MSKRTTAGKVQIWLSPKAARFAANACRMMADSDLDDENDNSYYRIIAGVIDDATEADPQINALVRASGHTKADASLILDEMVRNDQELGLFDPPGSESMRAHINAQAAEIDRLRAEVAELNADIEAGKAWLRDIYRPTTVKETGDV
jgi:hypothetical protein